MAEIGMKRKTALSLNMIATHIGAMQPIAAAVRKRDGWLSALVARKR